MIRPAAVPPMKWEIAGIVTTLAELAEKAGVEIRTSCEVDVTFAKSGAFDEVLLACGTEPILPRSGVDGDMLLSAVDVLCGRSWPGENVVIVGGGMIGCECAEFLSAYGKKITVVEMLDDVACDMHWNLRDILLDRLRRQGVDFICGARVKGAEHGEVVYERNAEEYILRGVDHVIFAVGLRPSEKTKKLKMDLEEAGISPTEVGDCCGAARLRESLVDAVEKATRL